ncbi:MAG TPA: deacetylase [Gammaproteobacteria bacterium]
MFREFAHDLLARDAGEIGMHLHAWNSPPIVPLTEDDYRWRPYLIEYPRDVMREKINVLTDTLRETFSTPIVSHRAGRWAFDRTYAHLLVEQGYLVDCSMTPGVSWGHEPGTPGGVGDVDYRAVPREAFWMDEDDVRRRGRLPLLEVPVTIEPGSRGWLPKAARRLLGRASWGNRAVERVMPSVHWFRPNRHNRCAMLQILQTERRRSADYVELMLHSSELMPGGSPYFPDCNAVERLYDTLEAVFSAGAGDFRGMTLAEYHARFVRARGEPASLGSPATGREPRHAECMEA